MLQRIITASILLIAVVLVYIYATGLQFSGFLLSLMLVSVLELCALLEVKNGILKYFNITVFAIAGFTIMYLNNSIINKIVLGAGALWWGSSAYFLIKGMLHSNFVISFNLLNQKMLKLLAPYFWLLPGMLASILLWQLDKSILALVCVLIWISDSAAYFVGRVWGKKLLLSKVSPKKTWEGLLAGIIVPILCYLSWYYCAPIAIMQQSHIIYQLLILTVTLSFGVIGDLTESYFKRLAGIKDSGTILPGHGGILDRLDSMLSAMPMVVIMGSMLC